MKRTIPLLFTCVLLLTANTLLAQSGDDGWISLFDGKTLNGWKAGENKSSFTVREGMIAAGGPRSHLFYVGPVENAIFTGFEFKVDVMTRPGSNGGIFFHTQYQETGWPKKGYEAQVNNTYLPDRRKTGSLIRGQDILTPPVTDNTWFTEHIIVDNGRIVIKVDGKELVNRAGQGSFSASNGTFALQAHDPGSTVFYKNIMVRPLPVIDFPLVDYHVHLKGGLTLDEAVAISGKNNVKFGIAQNCGLGFGVTDDAGARQFIEKLRGRPVYIGMQAEGREWLGLFSEGIIEKFDYVLSDALTFTDNKGRRTRLWMKNEVFVEDEQEFMEMYVDRIVAILGNEPIDIFANATFLPECIRDKYDLLWTRQRMERVINAAVKNSVAVEINARYRIPGKAFIQLGKKAGLKFSLGTNNGGKDLGNIEYCRRMIRECRLTQENLFDHKTAQEKRTQRRQSAR